MLNTSETTNSRSLKYLNSKIEFIRVIKGTNFDYFSEDSIKDFTSKEFVVSKLTDRMGMRLSGLKIKNLKKTNIKSEGLGKGVIQVPADGDPIVMLSDHGTIGGYPKIAVVISADYDRVCNLANNHAELRKFLGHGMIDCNDRYSLQSIKDNISLPINRT